MGWITATVLLVVCVVVIVLILRQITRQWLRICRRLHGSACTQAHLCFRALKSLMASVWWPACRQPSRSNREVGGSQFDEHEADAFDCRPARRHAMATNATCRFGL